MAAFAKGDAEDIAQEAFFRLWRMALDWKEDGLKVSTWLYQVVQNLCYDKLRCKPSTSFADIGEPKDKKLAVNDVLQGQKRANALYRAIAEQNSDLNTELEMFSTSAKWKMPRQSEDL